MDGGVDVFRLLPVKRVDEDRVRGKCQDGEFHRGDGQVVRETGEDLGYAPEDFDDGEGLEEEVVLGAVVEGVFVDAWERAEETAFVPEVKDFKGGKVVEGGRFTRGGAGDEGGEAAHVGVLDFGDGPGVAVVGGVIAGATQRIADFGGVGSVWTGSGRQGRAPGACVFQVDRFHKSFGAGLRIRRSGRDVRVPVPVLSPRRASVRRCAPPPRESSTPREARCMRLKQLPLVRLWCRRRVSQLPRSPKGRF